MCCRSVESFEISDRSHLAVLIPRVEITFLFVHKAASFNFCSA